MTRIRTLLLRGRRDRGAVTILGVVICFWLVTLCAITFDGALYNRAARAAHDDAGQAARAGAESIDAGAAINGQVAGVDASTAAAAATDYLNAHHQAGTVTTAGTTLTVTTTTTFTAPITHFSRTITSTASADLVRTLGDTPQ